MDSTAPILYSTHPSLQGGRSKIAQLVERPTKKPGAVNTDAGSSPRRGKGFFSQSQLPVQTVLRCPCSPRAQSLASTSRRTLNIPNTGSHTIVWTHKNATHFGMDGYEIRG